MRKVLLGLCFITVIAMALCGCSPSNPTPVATEYDTLNQLVEKEYSSVTLSVETDFGDDKLSGEYSITKSGERYTISYSFEQFSSFSNGELPNEYKTTHSGEMITQDGKVVQQSGESINIEVSDLTVSTIKFDKAYFTGIRSEDGSFKANVSNVNGFLGKTLTCTNMQVSVTYTSSHLNKMVITYVADSTNITLTYSFVA